MSSADSAVSSPPFDLEAQLVHRNHLLRARLLTLPRMGVQSACVHYREDLEEIVYWLNSVLPYLLECDSRLSRLPSAVLLIPHVDQRPFDVEMIGWAQQFLVRSYDPTYVFPSVPYGPPSPPVTPPPSSP